MTVAPLTPAQRGARARRHYDAAVAHLLAHRRHDAAVAFRRAMAWDPGDVRARVGLADLLAQDGDLGQAASAYRGALAEDCSSRAAARGLGVVLRQLGRHADAIAVFRKALRRHPASADLHLNLGVTLWDIGDCGPALAATRAAVHLDPGHLGARHNLAAMLRDSGRDAEAADAYAGILAIDPADACAGHLLASLQGRDTAGAPAAYVRNLFDSYADDFETELLEALEYGVPGLIASTVASLPRPCGAGRFRRCLDLGCGTGLAGVALRAGVERLEGVDLSPGMLGHARAKKVYDELAEGDLVGALLGTEPGTIDLLIAADVLIYCGGLDPVLGAARHALDPAGWFVFSLERHAAEGYRLQASGRYAHADRYVAAAASRAGLRVHSLQTIQVRLEAGAGLEGALWVLGPSESTPRNLRASGFPAFPGS